MADPGPTAAEIAQEIATAIAAAIPGGGAAAAPPATTFALSPALHQAGLVDYSTKVGTDIYGKATASLDTAFSLKKPNLRVLATELSTRALAQGWSDILTVNVGASNYSLLTQYNFLTVAQVKTHAETYIDVNNRNKQNDFQLFQCLQATLDAESKTKMAAASDEYMCGAAPKKPSGILFLKLLLSKSAAQAKTIASVARLSIMNLPKYMKEEAKGDILALHDHVDDLQEQLQSANEESTDVIVSLFTAYKTCTHEQFLNYIGRLEDQYEDATTNLELSDITEQVAKKYKKLKLLGEWDKPSKRESQLFALQSRIEQLVANRTRRRTRDPGTTTQPPPAATGSNRTNPGTGTNSGNSKINRTRPAWRRVTPATGEPHTKTVGDEEWHFCIHHGYWVKPTSAECRDKKPNNQQPDDIHASLADIGIEEASDDDTDQE